MYSLILCSMLLWPGIVSPPPPGIIAPMPPVTHDDGSARDGAPDLELRVTGVYTRERSGKKEGHGGLRLGVARREHDFTYGSLWSYIGFSGLYLSDVGEDSVGVGMELGLRYMLPATERYRLFTEFTGGILLASQHYPRGGTRENFTYQFQVGCSRRLSRETWFDLGLAFFHVSNGFTRGRDRNPGSNALSVLAGFTVPF